MLRRLTAYALFAAGLAAFLAITPAQAAPPPNMPGYRCEVLFEEQNPDIQVDGRNCTPINGAPAQGNVRGPFSIADAHDSYVCQSGRISPPWVWTRDCEPA